jgi:RPA family protein
MCIHCSHECKLHTDWGWTNQTYHSCGISEYECDISSSKRVEKTRQIEKELRIAWQAYLDAMTPNQKRIRELRRYKELAVDLKNFHDIADEELDIKYAKELEECLAKEDNLTILDRPPHWW